MVVCMLDLLVVMFCLFISGMIRYRDVQYMARETNLHLLFSSMIVIHIAVFYFLRVYEGFFRRGRYDELFLSVKYNLLLIGGSALLSFGLKSTVFTSRLMMGYFFILNVLGIWIAHILIRNTFRWRTRRATNLLLVTTSDQLEEILKTFQRSKETTWNIVGVILLGKKDRDIKLENIPIIPAVEKDYLKYATRQVVDEVFIHVDDIQKRERFLKKMILEFEKMGVVVNLNLDLFSLGVTGEKRVHKLERYHVIAFSSRLFDYRMVLIKRLVDIVGALLGLVFTVIVGCILAPFLLLESPGPLIFAQRRVGINGRYFNIYKFRSMYVDAEKRKKELMDQNEMQGLMFKIENDPRVTKVGAFIRKTSIDELPQFWNVLKGDMSLVGTRPPTLDEYKQYSSYQKRRISFRPGITGLWQISGRSNIKSFDEVVKLDLEYIDNWSLLLDFKIIFKTIWVVLKRSGAK